MKINYKKGSNILTLANGTTEINSDNIEKMQMKLLKKVMKLEIKKQIYYIFLFIFYFNLDGKKNF